MLGQIVGLLQFGRLFGQRYRCLCQFWMVIQMCHWRHSLDGLMGLPFDSNGSSEVCLDMKPHCNGLRVAKVVVFEADHSATQRILSSMAASNTLNNSAPHGGFPLMPPRTVVSTACLQDRHFGDSGDGNAGWDQFLSKLVKRQTQQL